MRSKHRLSNPALLVKFLMLFVALLAAGQAQAQQVAPNAKPQPFSPYAYCAEQIHSTQSENAGKGKASVATKIGDREKAIQSCIDHLYDEEQVTCAKGVSCSPTPKQRTQTFTTFNPTNTSPRSLLERIQKLEEIQVQLRALVDRLGTGQGSSTSFMYPKHATSSGPRRGYEGLSTTSIRHLEDRKELCARVKLAPGDRSCDEFSTSTTSVKSLESVAKSLGSFRDGLLKKGATVRGTFQGLYSSKGSVRGASSDYSAEYTAALQSLHDGLENLARLVR